MAEVVVRTLGPRGLAQEVVARGHTVQADEPVDAGGSDSGPTPYELLLGALGACTAMTVQMYAERKGWPLESVEVVLAHDRVHVEDCQGCDEQDTRLDRITKRLVLHGPLDAAQRQRLEEIADRCPVHRTLTGEIVVERAEA